MLVLKSTVIQHIIGVVGQASAALPLLLVTIFISRRSGLEQAGYFTILVGASAIIYAFSLWGMRTQIVLDGFKTHSVSKYATFRLISTMLAALAMAIFVDHGNIRLPLLVTIILYRSIDSLIDLNMAIDQVLLPNDRAIYNYAIRHIVKLLTFASATAAGVFFETTAVYTLLIIAGVVTLGVHAIRVIQQAKHGNDEWQFPSPSEIMSMFKRSGWFVVAAASCAIITNAPRISMEWIYAGNVLGVVGISLSVCTLFGMVFNMTWVRALPGFATTDNVRRNARVFIVENIVIGILLAAVCWTLLPWVVSVIFGFNNPQHIALSRDIMTASVAFFGGQIVSNLFKVTPQPWLEVLSYLLGFLAAVVLAISAPVFRDYFVMLIVAGMVMLIFSLTLFFLLTPPLLEKKPT